MRIRSSCGDSLKLEQLNDMPELPEYLLPPIEWELNERD